MPQVYSTPLNKDSFHQSILNSFADLAKEAELKLGLSPTRSGEYRLYAITESHASSYPSMIKSAINIFQQLINTATYRLVITDTPHHLAQRQQRKEIVCYELISTGCDFIPTLLELTDLDKEKVSPYSLKIHNNNPIILLESMTKYVHHYLTENNYRNIDLPNHFKRELIEIPTIKTPEQDFEQITAPEEENNLTDQTLPAVNHTLSKTSAVTPTKNTENPTEEPDIYPETHTEITTESDFLIITTEKLPETLKLSATYNDIVENVLFFDKKDFQSTEDTDDFIEINPENIPKTPTKDDRSKYRRTRAKETSMSGII